MTKTSEYKFVAWKLLGIIVLIFLIQVFSPAFTDTFKLVSSDAFLRPWILVTSIFLHGSLTHLLLNMFALGLFGAILEKFVGWRKFLIIFFVSGIIANLGSMFLYPSSLGASGAIFGVIGALALIKPKMTVWILGVPAPMIVAAAIWAAQDIIGLFVPSNVANLAHLIGLGVGILLGIPHFKREKNPPKVEVLSKSQIEDWERKHMRN